jgi:hypothetical protein
MRGWKLPLLCCSGLLLGACLSPRSRQVITPAPPGEGSDSTATAQAGAGNASDLVDFIADLRLTSDPAVMIAVLAVVIVILLGVVVLQGVTNIALMLLLWWVALFSHRREMTRIQQNGKRHDRHADQEAVLRSAQGPAGD